jgi:uracil-DNA glycosylase family 4
MSTSGDAKRRVARVVAQRLTSLQQAGVTQLPKRGKKAVDVASSSAKPQATSEAPVEKSVAKAVLRPKDRVAALDLIRQEVAGCTRCAKLCTTRTQTVFGVGDPNAKICFLGEAPGADEDRQGEPFVGRAGQLLNKMIVACGLQREEVYILNVLKCRPPENRNPLPDEVANCRGYFERQLDIIKPEVICCLGSIAAKSLLQTETTIGRLRGSWHDFAGIPVVCTYHPAYLLRNPPAKGDAWEDLKMMMRKLGVNL